MYTPHDVLVSSYTPFSLYSQDREVHETFYAAEGAEHVGFLQGWAADFAGAYRSFILSYLQGFSKYLSSLESQ